MIILGLQAFLGITVAIHDFNLWLLYNGSGDDGVTAAICMLLCLLIEFIDCTYHVETSEILLLKYITS